MKMAGKILCGLFVCLFLASVAYGEEKYICIAEKTVGFSYNEHTKEWQNTFFKDEDKYLLSKCPGSGCSFLLKELGAQFSTATCKSPFTKYGYIFCSSSIIQFKFNKDNGRYLLVYPIGYYNKTPEDEKQNNDTPYMQIGKCSPF